MDRTLRHGAPWAARAASTLLLLGGLAACGNGNGGGTPQPTPTAVAIPTAAPQPSATPPATGAANTLTFTPPIVQLDNPTSPGGTTAAADVTVEIAAYDGDGHRIVPSAANSLTVSLHGAPAGAVTPTSATLTSGSSFTFRYDGSYFPNPITLVAWTGSAAAATAQGSSTAGAGGAAMALDTTHVTHANPIDCTYGTASFALPLSCDDPDDETSCVEQAIENGLKVHAAVGYDAPGAADLVEFAIDTGSTGVIVPASELGPDAIGPGAAGTTSYDSSGNTYAGNYYVAPVSLALGDGSVVSTRPIKVLGITSAYCAPGYPKCDANPPKPDLHYLGVGFDRGTTNPQDQLGTPADNPFLHLTDGDDGTDVSPGYVLGGSSITVGIDSTTGYDTVALAPSTTVPGDWATMAGCYGFPDLPAPNQFCGTLLLDVGITEMFLDLEKTERPPGSEGDCTGPGTSCVPDGTAMAIVAGAPGSPAATYQFTLATEPSGPAPDYAQWIESSTVFVNTGRRPLLAYDYLYDARCGNVGFQAK